MINSGAARGPRKRLLIAVAGAGALAACPVAAGTACQASAALAGSRVALVAVACPAVDVAQHLRRLVVGTAVVEAHPMVAGDHPETGR